MTKWSTPYSNSLFEKKLFCKKTVLYLCYLTYIRLETAGESVGLELSSWSCRDIADGNWVEQTELVLNRSVLSSLNKIRYWKEFGDSFRQSVALKSIIKSKTVRRATKIRIYKTILRPVITCRFYTWCTCGLWQQERKRRSYIEERNLTKNVQRSYGE